MHPQPALRLSGKAAARPSAELPRTFVRHARSTPGAIAVLIVLALMALVSQFLSTSSALPYFSWWRPAPPPAHFAVLAMFKNEARAIREWMEHYIWQGVDSFLLLDNGSTDDWRSQLAGLEDFFTVLPAPLPHRQEAEYNALGLPWLWANGVDYVAVYDLDEFAFSTVPGRTLRDSVLRTFDSNASLGQLFCLWSMFGSSGHDRQPPSVREHFTWRKSGTTSGLNGKSVVRVSQVRQFRLHQHDVEGGTAPCPSDLQINHYAIQSRQFFEETKMTRGDAVTSAGDSIRTWAYFNAYDWKDSEDTALRDQWRGASERARAELQREKARRAALPAKRLRIDTDA